MKMLEKRKKEKDKYMTLKAFIRLPINTKQGTITTSHDITETRGFINKFPNKTQSS